MPSSAVACVPGGTRITSSSASGPVLVCPLAVTAAAGPVVRGAGERAEIAARGVREQDDAAAVTAVAAVGPALGHVGLAAEGHAAVTAAAALDVDLRPVLEHGDKIGAGPGRGLPIVEVRRRARRRKS